jgi:uncharacterized membrane protein YfcA
LNLFELTVAVVGFVAGVVAALAGFGVGSLLTPLLTSRFDAKLAVALVAIPHAVATAVRLWRLRGEISWPVLKRFGTASAVGGLVGAYVFTQVAAGVLATVLGVLLIAVGTAELFGLVPRLRLRAGWALVAGAISGIFGGMVGNQGGVRSAGLLAFQLSPREFVATAAAIALIVDVVRLPLYLWNDGHRLAAEVPILIIATGGVVVGTFAGTSLLLRLEPRMFRRAIGAILVALGVWLIA